MSDINDHIWSIYYVVASVLRTQHLILTIMIPTRLVLLSPFYN